LAVIVQKLAIEADPTRPKEEIVNIINGFLQLWPGSEAVILRAIRTEIDKAIEMYEKGAEANANDVSRNGQQSGDGAGGSDHSDTDNGNRT
jgi:rubrerythrin